MIQLNNSLILGISLLPTLIFLGICLLAEEANKWALEYAIEDYKTLFSKNEAINDPIEIAIVIRLINNKYKVTEDEIFEMPLDLSEALRKFESDLVQRVAQIMTKRYIFKIRIKDIYD